MSDERMQAWNALHDPSTEASRLMEIAHAHPEFADAIVAHPQVYPELTAWLATSSQAAAAAPVTAPVAVAGALERDGIAAELADPATSAARLMEIAQQYPARGDAVAAHPAAYPALIEWLAVAKPDDDPQLAAARAELAAPAIAGSRLAELAAAHPQLHVELAGHPRAYPDLLDWLASRPDGRTQQAVAARRAQDATPAPAPVAVLPASDPAAPVMEGKSGWEHADNALDKVERAGEIVVNVFTVIYGIFLIVVGIAIASLAFSMGLALGWLGVVVAIYGVYVALPLPGYKVVIW